MSLLQAIFMGIIQGITEFLPVSSSGHLALFKNLLHIDTNTGLLFDVLLHIGTLLAVFVVYHHDIGKMIVEFIGVLKDCFQNLRIWIENKQNDQQIPYIRIVHNSYRKMGLLILVSTIPTGVIGVVSADLVEMADEILLIPGIGLIVTSMLLFLADRIPDGQKLPRRVSYTSAFIIGICQGIATLPGISRSGTTVTACLASGFKRNFAVKYSFLMSIPAILGSLVFELKDFGSLSITASQAGCYIAGMVVSAVVGYICIKTMLVIVKNKKFTFFAVYCLLIGVISIGGYFYTA